MSRTVTMSLNSNNNKTPMKDETLLSPESSVTTKESRSDSADLTNGLSELTFVGTRSRKETSYSDDLSSYTVPKRTEDYPELVEKYCKMFTVTTERLKEISQTFQEELQLSLECHKRHPETWVDSECNFKMLDSCVEKLPSGNETGIYYAVDFGGTNFRAVRVALQGSGVVKCTQAKFSLKYEGPTGHKKGLLDCRSTATQLFDHFAQRVRIVMQQAGDLERAKKHPVGVAFTFSFPCVQTSLNTAVLLEWTKGFETGKATDDPVEKRDVGKLLTEAFKRNSVPAVVSSIVNDTVGTLLSCAYQKPANTPKCLVGMILGTGMNGCYVEPKGTEFGYTGRIVNIECGSFSRDLPVTEVDAQVDWDTWNKGKQLLEKLTAGAYLGELIRLMYIRIFRNRAAARAWTRETFSGEDASCIINDRSTALDVAYQTVKKKWDASLCDDDLRDLRKLCKLVFDRSAALAAAAICAICKQTGELNADSKGLTVGLDGSLYVKNPWYAHRLRAYMESIIGKDLARKVHLVAAHDGSGQGAAILASVSHPSSVK